MCIQLNTAECVLLAAGCGYWLFHSEHDMTEGLDFSFIEPSWNHDLECFRRSTEVPRSFSGVPRRTRKVPDVVDVDKMKVPVAVSLLPASAKPV